MIATTEPEGKLKQRIDDINAMSIAIDTYDDIFSDFDPRDILQRELSEDFIIELRHRYRENPGGKNEVIIFGPGAIEDKNFEKNIITRIRRYFHSNSSRKSRIVNRIRIRGMFFVALGMAALSLMTFLTYKRILDTLTLEVMGIILTPLGWFGIWEGFLKIVDEPFLQQRDADIFKKLSKLNYRFEYLKEEKPEPKKPEEKKQ